MLLSPTCDTGKVYYFYQLYLGEPGLHLEETSMPSHIADAQQGDALAIDPAAAPQGLHGVAAPVT